MALGVLFQEQSPPVEAAELTREEERPGFPFWGLGFRVSRKQGAHNNGFVL